ncbi:MAG: DedA family protein [Micrococcaceae bacterium]
MHSLIHSFSLALATTAPPPHGGLSELFDPRHLIHAMGPWLLLGLFLIIFFEVSVPFGVILPGDSLLFTLGLLMATGKVHYPPLLVCLVLALAADLGGHFGYYLGNKAGPSLINNPKSRWIKPEFIKKSHNFFEKRGGSALVLARFVAVVRTFASSFAGISNMNYKKFAFFNLISAILWCPSIVLAGYYLGRFPWVRHNIEWIMVGIALIAATAIYLEIRRTRKESNENGNY